MSPALDAGIIIDSGKKIFREIATICHRGRTKINIGQGQVLYASG